jgi:uncharacterized Zn-finger protein
MCHLKRHVKIHQTDHFPFACQVEGCTEKFNKRSKLERHVRWHQGEGPYPCTTEGCRESFASTSARAKHVARKHTSKRHRIANANATAEKKYKCPHSKCDEVFSTMSELKQHQSEQLHRTCSECGAESIDANHKLTHRAPLMQRKVFFCEFPNCVASFTKRSNLSAHVLSTHENYRPFECEECGMKFSLKQSWKRHSVRCERKQNETKRLRLYERLVSGEAKLPDEIEAQ